jgi:hypothetical protein
VARAHPLHIKAQSRALNVSENRNPQATPLSKRLTSARRSEVDVGSVSMRAFSQLAASSSDYRSTMPGAAVLSRYSSAARVSS